MADHFMKSTVRCFYEKVRVRSGLEIILEMIGMRGLCCHTPTDKHTGSPKRTQNDSCVKKMKALGAVDNVLMAGFSAK